MRWDFKQGFFIMDIEHAVDFETVKGLPIAGITKVTPVFVNHAGPLPLGKAFQSSGGSFLIFVSGSLWSNNNSSPLMQAGIYLDGEQVQTCQEFANSTGSHMSLVPVLFTTGKQPAGNHVIELRVLNGISDQNDYYNVTVVELA
jgi:hypothetical protein